VSQLLASFRASPMPDALSQRLHTALSAEATRRAAGGDRSAVNEADRGLAGARSPVLIPGRPDLPARRARPQARRLRFGAWSSPMLLRALAAAGALVLLVGGGVLLANQRGVGSSYAPAAAPERTPRVRSNVAVGSTAAVSLRYLQNGHYVYSNAVTSDVDYTRADLPDRVRHAVANSTEFAAPSPGAATPNGAAAQPQRLLKHATVDRLESCLSTLTSNNLGVALLVEVAHYLGRPATIIVYRHASSAFDVIVVGEACGPAGQDIIARFTIPTS
jgi:hypothetical protein